MKIVNLNTEALNSRAFNSIQWSDELFKCGISSHLLVLRDNQDEYSPYVSSWVGKRNKIQEFKVKFLDKLQYRYGFQNKFLVKSNNLFKNNFYKQADLVHLHLVDPNFLTLKTLKRISEEKPLVWTWHDPWALTGHCVYPGNCKEWINSCKVCPDLSRTFSVKRDRTFLNRLEKYELLSNMDVQIHLASNWMKDLTIKSGIKLKREPVVIPLPSSFGIQARIKDRKKFRELHEISDNQIVIGFRDTPLWQKGTRNIENVLIKLEADKNLILISVDATETLKQFQDKFRVIELGYLNNSKVISEFYSGIDLFMSLSTEEAYGVMAAESISLGTPVLTLEGTGVDENVRKFGGFIAANLDEVVKILKSISGNASSRHITLASLINKAKLHELSVEKFVLNLKSIYLKTIERGK